MYVYDEIVVSVDYIVMIVKHKITKHHEVCLIKLNVHLIRESKNAFCGIDKTVACYLCSLVITAQFWNRWFLSVTLA